MRFPEELCWGGIHVRGMEAAVAPVEYAVAVDQYLDRAALSSASRRVYQISLASWAWPLIGQPIPLDPVRGQVAAIGDRTERAGTETARLEWRRCHPACGADGPRGEDAADVHVVALVPSVEVALASPERIVQCEHRMSHVDGVGCLGHDQ